MTSKTYPTKVKAGSRIKKTLKAVPQQSSDENEKNASNLLVEDSGDEAQPEKPQQSDDVWEVCIDQSDEVVAFDAAHVEKEVDDSNDEEVMNEESTAKVTANEEVVEAAENSATADEGTNVEVPFEATDSYDQSEHQNPSEEEKDVSEGVNMELDETVDHEPKNDETVDHESKNDNQDAEVTLNIDEHALAEGELAEGEDNTKQLTPNSKTKRKTKRASRGKKKTKIETNGEEGKEATTPSSKKRPRAKAKPKKAAGTKTKKISPSPSQSKVTKSGTKLTKTSTATPKKSSKKTVVKKKPVKKTDPPEDTPQKSKKRKEPDSNLETSPSKKMKPKSRFKIAASSFSEEQMELLYPVAKHLGAEIVKKISPNTSHLILGQKRRTFKVLKAITEGIWILNFTWVLESIQANAWLPEEKYEARNWFPGCEKARLARVTKSSKKQKVDLFEGLSFFSGPRNKADLDQLGELIEACGGEMVDIISEADLILDEKPSPMVLSEGKDKVVSAEWVKKSIVNFDRQPKC